MLLGLISAKLLLIAKQLPFWAHLVAGVKNKKEVTVSSKILLVKIFCQAHCVYNSDFHT